MSDPEQLRMADRVAIQELKARYFRFVDTKQWGPFAELFTDDVVFRSPAVGDPDPDPAPVAEGRDAFVGFVTRFLGPSLSVHTGGMPEIDFDGPDTARGVWQLSDWIEDVENGRGFRGRGHYHERYRREDGAWRISEITVVRLRVDSLRSNGG